MIKITLYENAIDSINHGIEHFNIANKRDSSADFKQAILLMFQGTELLLKSLLSQIDVIYIFDKNSPFEKCTDPLKPTIDELNRCKSLEINKLCREIYKYYSDEYPKGSLKIIEKMARTRNQIQHFGIIIDKSTVIAALGQLYFEVISVGLNLLGNIGTSDKNLSLQEEIQKVYASLKMQVTKKKF